MMSYINHVIGTKNERLTSGFRIPSRPKHDGADYIAGCDSQITPRGVDILALADGTVSRIYYNAARGHVVEVTHNSRVKTIYQHLRDIEKSSISRSITVKVGSTVKRGQVIAVMGNSGDCRSSRKDVPKEFLGTHLHFEVIIDGVPVNPEPYLLGTQPIPGASANTANTAPSTVTVTQASGGAFKVGDKVKIKDSATKYVTGEVIPARLKGATDEIMQLSETSRNAAIKSADAVLLKGIYSWVYKANVEKID